MTTPTPGQGTNGGCLKTGAIGCGSFFLAGIALLGLLSSCGSRNHDDSTDWQRLAVSTCHESVQKQLKNPKAADYSDETVTRTTTGWDITGTVYSTNTFGGTVPATYTCIVTKDTDGVRAKSRVDG